MTGSSLSPTIPIRQERFFEKPGEKFSKNVEGKKPTSAVKQKVAGTVKTFIPREVGTVPHKAEDIQHYIRL